MADPAPRMVSVPDALTLLAEYLEACQHRARVEGDYREGRRIHSLVEAMTAQHMAEDALTTLNPVHLRALASPALAAPAPAEQAMETLLMQGRSTHQPTTYDLVITARADTVKGMVGVLTAIAYNINHAGDREGHEENEYVGYLFKMLSPAPAQADAPGDAG